MSFHVKIETECIVQMFSYLTYGWMQGSACAGVDDGMIALLLMTLRMYPTSGYKYIREPETEISCAGSR